MALIDLRYCMPRLKRVAILIETSRQKGRELLRGVMKYHQTHLDWTIYFEPRGHAEVMPAWLPGWEGDGILARITNPKMGEILAAKGVPVIDLVGLFQEGIPGLTYRNEDVVRMALDHLRSLGLKQVAFCGLPAGQLGLIDDRSSAFQRQAEAAGLSWHLYRSKGGKRHNNQLTDERDRIAQWIKTLPRPIGVMAYNDDRGLQVLDACRAIGVAAPDEVAVIGVDDDEFLAELAHPPLTSIQSNEPEIGYRAAEQLQRMMTGKKPDFSCLQLEAQALIPRKSTQMLAFEDPEVKQVVQFIRAHACEPISVEDVIAEVPLSRRRLEQRFQAAMGHTLHKEITRVRLDRAQQLLAETNLSVVDVAHQVGIATASHLCNAFKRRHGLTPGEFRREHLMNLFGESGGQHA
jgi:LacI family transcriptional regulator